ncbi:MAG: septal ring lytic transglycosylase RlpA family protein [Chlorobiota bacterium]
MPVNRFRQWSPLGWLVFWGVFVVVLSVTILVQAQERAEGDERGLQPDSSIAGQPAFMEWTPFAVQEGLATWYGPGFHGRRTASGKRYDMYELTAAHRWLPFGALVKVSLPDVDSAVVVQITDRGPFVRRRIIDLSWAAARTLGVRLHPVRIAAYLPPRDSAQVLGFTPGWGVYVGQRSAFVLVDSLRDWTQAVRRWERYRQEVPAAWLLATWLPGVDSAEGVGPDALCFYVGVPRVGAADSLLGYLQ